MNIKKPNTEIDKKIADIESDLQTHFHCGCKRPLRKIHSDYSKVLGFYEICICDWCGLIYAYTEKLGLRKVDLKKEE